jgi:hypothetical protein
MEKRNKINARSNLDMINLGVNPERIYDKKMLERYLKDLLHGYKVESATSEAVVTNSRTGEEIIVWQIRVEDLDGKAKVLRFDPKENIFGLSVQKAEGNIYRMNKTDEPEVDFTTSQRLSF